MGLRRIPISSESPAELIPVSPAFKTSQLSFLPYTHFHLLAFFTYLFAPWLLCLTSLESIIFSFVTVYVCVRMYVGVRVCTGSFSFSGLHPGSLFADLFLVTGRLERDGHISKWSLMLWQWCLMNTLIRV